MWFKSHPRNQKKTQVRRTWVFFWLSGLNAHQFISPTSVARWVSKIKTIDNRFYLTMSLKARFFRGECTEPMEKEMRQGPGDVRTKWWRAQKQKLHVVPFYAPSEPSLLSHNIFSIGQTQYGHLSNIMYYIWRCFCVF